jgi:hypothetical protein
MVREDFLCGVIEGFYGRPWPFETRLAYAGYLQQLGLNTALYCPKADPLLRKRWQEHWPENEWQQLQTLARAHRTRGLNWGVGLSPFALYMEYGSRQRHQLRTKLAQLAELEAPLIAILFDDMPGDVKDLAARQAEIVADVCHWTENARVLVCPTYYSFDPVLETYFGAMPEDYWPRLGRDLPSEVGIFWTGNTVCSEAVSTADIEAINRQFGRPVTLWDNYPVNDGAVRSNFLYCQPPIGRDPALEDLLAGHLSNPMNQGLLSLPAVAGLATLYGLWNGGDRWLARILGEDTWPRLLAHRDKFRSLGLNGIGESEREQLACEYDALSGPAAREVAQWLRGAYTFDPACLTD